MKFTKESWITLLMCLILLTVSILFWLILGGTTLDLLIFMGINFSMIFIYLLANIVFIKKSKEADIMRRKKQNDYEVVRDAGDEEVVEFNGIEEPIQEKENKKLNDENIIQEEKEEDELN
ncbi:hypothetical protein J4232_02550 [Candidatus Woesearchaeota archaeon]|nr:hypothetical protein [Candidatus Woesearchaeota archaeon]